MFRRSFPTAFCVCELVNMWCLLVFFSAVGERGIPERLPVFRLSFLIALDRVTLNCRYKRARMVAVCLDF